MKIGIIKVSPRFEQCYRKLPAHIRTQAKEREKIFRENPFQPSLKTHKLHGQEKDAWAFSVNYDYRIKFIFLGDAEVLFLDIGTHDIYR